MKINKKVHCTTHTIRYETTAQNTYIHQETKTCFYFQCILTEAFEANFLFPSGDI